MDAAKFLRDTIDVVAQIESRFIELARRLYKIKTEQLWVTGGYESFAEFLKEAKVQEGFASILTSIYRHYVIEKNVPEEQLYGAGYSNLYEAIPLLETSAPDLVVEKAKLLTRAEIKDEVREKEFGVCTHEGYKQTVFHRCDNCGKFHKV